MEDKYKLLSDIYGRLVKLFGTDRIVIIGGAAVALSCDPLQQIHDIDVALDPKLLYEKDKRIEENGFRIVRDYTKIAFLVDKISSMEIDLRIKQLKFCSQEPDEKPRVPWIGYVPRAER